MVDVIYTDNFEKEIKKFDNSVKKKVVKQIQKIIQNPETGKPLRYNLKNERTVYVWPFRIVYTFDKSTIYFLRCQHRKKVY